MEATPDAVQATTVHASSMPTGVFLIISMFLVSLAFREVNRQDRSASLAGLKKMLSFAGLHVVLGTAANLMLTWLTFDRAQSASSPEALLKAYLLASGLNALFPSLLGLGGVAYLIKRRQKKD